MITHSEKGNQPFKKILGQSKRKIETKNYLEIETVDRTFIANLSARLKVKTDSSLHFCQPTLVQIKTFFENYSFSIFFKKTNSKLFFDIGKI